MKLKLKHVILAGILYSTALGVFTSCTQNVRAKSFGGTANVSLSAGQKLVTATWKDQELWYLTRPMRSDESPESYTLSEESSWGMIEGKVIFSESK